eukprot:Colp12_sorted_trinity150504_noHs@35323
MDEEEANAVLMALSEVSHHGLPCWVSFYQYPDTRGQEPTIAYIEDIDYCSITVDAWFLESVVDNSKGINAQWPWYYSDHYCKMEEVKPVLIHRKAFPVFVEHEIHVIEDLEAYLSEHPDHAPFLRQEIPEFPVYR